MATATSDLDLRKLRYFVVLAEELNFGRAADRLHIAQPVLTRQIRSLEEDFDVRLFDRDSRGTVLTDAGEQLLEDSRPLLATAAALRAQLAALSEPVRHLTVGVMPGLLATAAVASFEAANAPARVTVRRVSWDDQLDVVRDGTVDVVYARDAEGDELLSVMPLLEEGRDVVLPLGHDLATQVTVTPTDLADVLLLQDVRVAPEWQAVASPRMRREAARIEHASTVEEKLELVAAGRGFVILPHSTTAAYRRPDVSIVPAADFTPSKVSLVTRRRRRDALLDEFVRRASSNRERSLTT